MPAEETGDRASADLGVDGAPLLHEVPSEEQAAEARRQEQVFRRQLNQEARRLASSSIHSRVKLIVHRPEYTAADRLDYERLSRSLLPIVQAAARQMQPLLEYEEAEWSRNQLYGIRFQADRTAYRDYRHFAKKRPPSEAPTLAVGLRVDESASMSAFGRLEAAKRAAVALYEFGRLCGIPVLIYGDTADVSRLEQMSLFAYVDFDRSEPEDRFRLMGIRPRANNRDGLALRLLAERLAAAPQETKLLIGLSDGQPKALDDYTGSYAREDIRHTIAEYERKGVTFLAAAIGQDKEVLGDIYGPERFLDITNLDELPARLVRVVARYLRA